MSINRALEGPIINISKTFPVLLVTGPRGVGKTTLLKHLADSNRKYVTLDDPEARFLAKTDPALFMQRYTPPVLIDEIQYAPELLPYIKISVDNSKRNGDFWLIGSQAFHSIEGVSESLAGRVGIVNLLGLSASEINAVPSVPFTTDPQRLIERIDEVPKQSLNEIYARIFKGSMPALYTNDELDWENYYSSYVNTFLQRDIRDLTQVGDEIAFYNFLTAVAARTAQPIVYEELARIAGISAPTAKKWLSILVSSHIIAIVQPYHSNVLKRITKMPLMHFLDTGLCAHLLKWDNPETLEKGPMSGAFFESYVFSEIYKSYLNAGKQPPLFYYRDKDGKEIDLLIYQNGTLYPIKIKKSASPGKAAIKHFSVLETGTKGAKRSQSFATGNGAVVCMATDLLPLDEQNWCVPVWLI